MRLYIELNASDLMKSKMARKPYGHVAYTRRTKSGKLVQVQQRGARQEPQKPNVMEHVTDERLFARMVANKGFTFNVQGQHFVDTGYAVSVNPEFEISLKGATKPADLGAYLELLKPYFDKHDDACFGVWYDEPADKWYLDVSRVTTDEETARQLAQQHGQEGYFDLNTKSTKIVKDKEERRIDKTERFSLFNAEDLSSLLNRAREAIRRKVIQKAARHVIHPGSRGGIIFGHTASGEPVYTHEAPHAEAVKVPFTRMTSNIKTEHYGSKFGQDIEPAGEYMSHRTTPAPFHTEEYGNEKWATGKTRVEHGVVHFQKPYMLHDVPDDSVQWKKRLSSENGDRKGRVLSNHLKRRGYDGVVAVAGTGHVVEMVNLSGHKEPPPAAELKKSLEAAERPVKAYRGSCVVVPVPARVAERLAMLRVPGARPPYHLTLLMVAKDAAELDDYTRTAIERDCRAIAMKYDPLLMRMNGFGRLVNEDGQQVWYASFDGLGLAELRTDLMRAVLKHTAIPSDHDFIPHVTLGYLKEGEQWSPPNWRAEDMPVFVCNALSLNFGAQTVPMSLVGPTQQVKQLVELTKAEAVGARLVVLSKGQRGRPRGSVNQGHKWIARFLLPPGPHGEPRYHRVYPKDGDVDENGHLTRPVAQIVNDDLFGDAKEGRAGAFVEYHDAHPSSVPPESPKERAKWIARMKRRYPYLARPNGAPITPEMIGKDRTLHVPRIAGFLSYELSPEIAAAGYKLPLKVLNFHLQTPEEIEAASKLVPGVGVSEGQDGEPQEHGPHDKVPDGEKHIHHYVTEDDAMLGALQEFAQQVHAETVDPLAEAEELADKHNAKVEAFPSWMVEKYSSEQELLDELKSRPVTTLITLGKYNPRNQKVQAQLAKEWAGIIHNTAKKIFDAYKVTGRYREKEAEDARSGGSRAVGDYRKEVMDDLKQRGLMELFEQAPTYHANHEWESRFDKTVYKRVFGAMAKYARDQARYETGSTEEYQPEGGTYEPLVREEDVEEAAHKQGRQIELSPQEQHELQAYTAPAQATLARVLSNGHFSTTYRRLLAARLWLGNEAQERGQIEGRKAVREVSGQVPQQHAAAAEREVSEVLAAEPKDDGDELKAAKAKWVRQWTGPNSVLEQHGTEWVDPRTGETVDLSQFTRKHQIATLNKWFDEAIDEVKRQLSVPVMTEDMAEHQSKLRHVVKVRPADEAVTVKLQGRSAVLAREAGEKPTETRILTPEGAMVKRWLELEAKLASQNRRQFTERDQHKELRVQRHFVAAPTKEAAKPKWNAAAAFFSATENQELARRLGVSPVAVSAGLYRHPGLSHGAHVEHHLAAAEKFHAKLQELGGMDEAALDSYKKDRKERIENLASLGKWTNTNGRVSWRDSGKGLHALHEAVEDFNAQRGSKDRVALERAKNRLKEVVSHVQPLYPALVKDYVEAIQQGTTPTAEVLDQHKRNVSNSLRDLQEEHELAEFEQQRRKAATKVARKVGIVKADALTKAFYDLDFALGGLYAAMV